MRRLENTIVASIYVVGFTLMIAFAIVLVDSL